MVERPPCSRTTCEESAVYRYDHGPYHSTLCLDHADARWSADPDHLDAFEPLTDAAAERLPEDHDAEVDIRYRTGVADD